MNSTRGLEPWMKGPVEYLILVAAHNGLAPRLTSTYRSAAQQARLYAAYRSGRAQFPAAPPGQSYHEYGRAVDIVVNQSWGYRALGELWKRMGGGWWASDRIHFQA